MSTLATMGPPQDPDFKQDKKKKHPLYDKELTRISENITKLINDGVLDAKMLDNPNFQSGIQKHFADFEQAIPLIEAKPPTDPSIDLNKGLKPIVAESDQTKQSAINIKTEVQQPDVVPVTEQPGADIAIDKTNVDLTGLDQFDLNKDTGVVTSAENLEAAGRSGGESISGSSFDFVEGFSDAVTTFGGLTEDLRFAISDRMANKTKFGEAGSLIGSIVGASVPAGLAAQITRHAIVNSSKVATFLEKSFPSVHKVFTSDKLFSQFVANATESLGYDIPEALILSFDKDGNFDGKRFTTILGLNIAGGGAGGTAIQRLAKNGKLGTLVENFSDDVGELQIKLDELVSDEINAHNARNAKKSVDRKVKKEFKNNDELAEQVFAKQSKIIQELQKEADDAGELTDAILAKINRAGNEIKEALNRIDDISPSFRDEFDVEGIINNISKPDFKISDHKIQPKTETEIKTEAARPVEVKTEINSKSITKSKKKLSPNEKAVEAERIGVKKEKFEESDRYDRPLEAGVRGPINVDVLIDIPKKFFKSKFTKHGLLPSTAWKDLTTQESWMRKQLSIVGQNSRDLSKSMDKMVADLPISQRGQLSDNIELKVDKALRGDKSVMAELSEDVQNVVRSMQQHINELSNQSLRDGLIQDKLVAKVKRDLKNNGVYITRTYLSNVEPNSWIKQLDKDPKSQKIKNRAIAYLKTKYPGMNSYQLDAKLLQLLHDEKAPMEIISGGKLTIQQMRILKNKGAIPESVRTLLGEVNNPIVNYSRSVQQMSSIISQDRYFKSLNKRGIKEGWVFDTKEPPNKKHAFQIKGARFGDLEGKWTTEDIHEVLNAYGKAEHIHPIMRFIYGANSIAKATKTILSFPTHVRNVQGNFFFLAANGNLVKGVLSGSAKLRQLVTDRKAWRAAYNEMVELGIVKQSVNENILRRSLEDALVDKGANFEQIIDARWKKHAKKSLETVARIYGAEDDIFKISGYYAELQKYLKAGLSHKRASKIAADNVIATMPTYSELPIIMKDLSRFPLFGTFVAFPAEVIRNSFNTLRLGVREIKNSNPKIKLIGTKRLAGLAAVMTAAPYTIESFFGSGRSPEEEKAVESFLPPWDKSGQKVWTKDGYINMSRNIPQFYIVDPMVALTQDLSDKDITVKSFEAFKEFFSPFVSGELGLTTIREVTSGIREDGSQLYDWNNDDHVTILQRGMAHMLKKFQDGTTKGISRIVKEMQGGDDADVKREIMGFFGVRESKFGKEQILMSYGFQFREFGEGMRHALKVMSRALKADIKTFNEADQKSLNLAAERIANMRSVYLDALTLGVTKEELLRKMMIGKSALDNNDFIRKLIIGMVVTGTIKPEMVRSLGYRKLIHDKLNKVE